MKYLTEKLCALGLLSSLCLPNPAWGQGGSWVRPTKSDAPLVWGRTDGVVFGLPSPGGMPGPRGLIRVGIPGKKTDQPQLINFIAIEPVVAGFLNRYYRWGFSELEPSQLDRNEQGKRLWVHVPGDEDQVKALAGELETLTTKPQQVEQLTVRIEVETYNATGAKVYLIARMQSDMPEEIAFAVYQHTDSAPVEELTLTATMGNYERLRYLWLRNRLVDSRTLYEHDSPDGFGFMERENYPLVDMLRTWDGDAIALCTANEENPSAIQSLEPSFWNYLSSRLTQYWRVPAKDLQPDLRVRVNGRNYYWISQTAVPGGAAFENFEMRQRYVPGQVFIVGITRKEPWEFQPPLPGLAKVPGE